MKGFATQYGCGVVISDKNNCKNHLKYTEINIKEGMPSVTDALDLLKSSLDRCRRNKYECVLVIHGYGSKGVGGAINEKSRHWMRAQVRSGRIKSIIAGEDFSIFDSHSLKMKSRYPELEQLFRVCNHGVTVVEL